MATINADNFGTGTATQVLTSNGAGVAPTFQAIPAAGVTSLAGTANQITASASTGAVTLSIPSTFIAPGTIAATTTVTAATDLIATAGNLLLPTTSSTVGQIKINGTRYLHAYGTGATNVFLGTGSGNFTLNAAVAINNTGVGTSTLVGLTSGSANTAIGFSSGNALTTGVNNTSLGYNALLTESTGSNNTALGYETLKVATNDNNVAVGIQSLVALTSGARNIAIGAAAAPGLLTGTDNICIGYQAGQNYVGAESGNILIGLGKGTAAESNVTRIGYTTANASVQTKAFIDGTYNVAVGATAGVGLIDSLGQHGSISGTSSQVLIGGTKPAWGSVTLTTQVTGVLPIANGGTNASSMATTDGVVYYDGTRLVTTSAGTSTQVLTSNGPGVAPTFQAAASGGVTSLTGTANQVTVSASTGAVTLSTPSTFIAPGSIASTTTITAATGLTVTAGDITQTAATGGNFNLAECTGSTAGVINSWDYIGGSWILKNFIHNYGADVARNRLGYNTFIGYNAGNFTLTVGTAQANTAVGAGGSTFGNLLKLTTGSYNNSFGSASLIDLTSGSGNVGFGGYSLEQLTTGSNNTAIGSYNGSVAAGINYTSSESNNIMINNAGTVGESNVLRIGAATGTGTWQINSAFIAGIQGITVTGTAVLVSSSDQLGIAVSSRRYKENITDMGSYSKSIQKLRPVLFNYKVGEDQSQQSGLIAEEVALVMPQLVVLDKEGLPQSVKYHDLPALLLNELQKALFRIEALEAKVGRL